MGKKKFFAVARGRQPGLFESWAECERQVKGYNNNLYKGFATLEDAREFLRSHGVNVGVRKRTNLDGGDFHDETLATRGTEDADVVSAAQTAPLLSPRTEKSCKRALMFFDGASKRNPGDAGFGAVIFDRDTEDVVREVTGFMPEETNNVAEYSGLIAGLKACLEIGVRDVHVKGDSKLVINQVNNDWKVKNENLMRYHRVARKLADRFERFKAEHVYRESNTHADRLSNEAVVEKRLWKLEDVEAECATGGTKRKRDEAEEAPE